MHPLSQMTNTLRVNLEAMISVEEVFLGFHTPCLYEGFQTHIVEVESIAKCSKSMFFTCTCIHLPNTHIELGNIISIIG